MKKMTWIPLAAGALAGCAEEVRQPVSDYLGKAPAGVFSRGVEDIRVSRFRSVFEHLDADDLPERVRQAYAPDLFFNDTFHVLQTRWQVERYFMSLQGKADTTVTVLDAVTVGDHAWIRWTMSIRFQVLWTDVDATSVGVTHVHWNADGLIDLHQDYWDGVQGFYGHLPVFGTMIRALRSRLGDVSP